MIKNFHTIITSAGQQMLVAMASTRSEARLRVGSFSVTLTDHLVKLLLTGGQTQNYSGWLREVINYLKSCEEFSYLKGGSRLKEQDFKDLLFDYQLTSIRNRLYNDMDSYLPKAVKTPKDYDEVAELIIKDLKVLEETFLLPFLLGKPVVFKQELTSELLSESGTFTLLRRL
jgi:hypothetical protein